MKRTSFLLLITAVVIGLKACKKEVFENSGNGIVGKWQLTEMFNGYVNGGDFLWHPVATDNAHTLQFSANGQYTKQEKFNGTLQQCSGTYQLFSRDSIEINSTCQTGGEKAKISELTNRSLILDYPVREGVIKYRYVATP